MTAAKATAPASTPKTPKKITDREWLAKIEKVAKDCERLKLQHEKKKAEAKACKELLSAATEKLHDMTKHATSPGPLFAEGK